MINQLPIPSQVRLQGDFAKPPEKRFNYKHCFDALFRVCDTLNLVLKLG